MQFYISYGLKLLYSAVRRRLTLYERTGVSEFDVPYLKVGSYIVAKSTTRKYGAADDQ